MINYDYSDSQTDVTNNTMEVCAHIEPRKKLIYVPISQREEGAVREKLTELQRRVVVVSPKVFHTNLDCISYEVLFAVCR